MPKQLQQQEAQSTVPNATRGTLWDRGYVHEPSESYVMSYHPGASNMESIDMNEKSDFDTNIQATQSTVPMPEPGSPSLLPGPTGASSTLDKYTKSGGDS